MSLGLILPPTQTRSVSTRSATDSGWSSFDCDPPPNNVTSGAAGAAAAANATPGHDAIELVKFYVYVPPNTSGKYFLPQQPEEQNESDLELLGPSQNNTLLIDDRRTKGVALQSTEGSSGKKQPTTHGLSQSNGGVITALSTPTHRTEKTIPRAHQNETARLPAKNAHCISEVAAGFTSTASPRDNICFDSCTKMKELNNSGNIDATHSAREILDLTCGGSKQCESGLSGCAAFVSSLNQPEVNCAMGSINSTASDDRKCDIPDQNVKNISAADSREINCGENLTTSNDKERILQTSECDTAHGQDTPEPLQNGLKQIAADISPRHLQLPSEAITKSSHNGTSDSHSDTNASASTSTATSPLNRVVPLFDFGTGDIVQCSDADPTTVHHSSTTDTSESDTDVIPNVNDVLQSQHSNDFEFATKSLPENDVGTQNANVTTLIYNLPDSSFEMRRDDAVLKDVDCVPNLEDALPKIDQIDVADTCSSRNKLESSETTQTQKSSELAINSTENRASSASDPKVPNKRNISTESSISSDSSIYVDADVDIVSETNLSNASNKCSSQQMNIQESVQNASNTLEQQEYQKQSQSRHRIKGIVNSKTNQSDKEGSVHNGFRETDLTHPQLQLDVENSHGILGSCEKELGATNVQGKNGAPDTEGMQAHNAIAANLIETIGTGSDCSDAIHSSPMDKSFDASTSMHIDNDMRRSIAVAVNADNELHAEDHTTDQSCQIEPKIPPGNHSISPFNDANMTVKKAPAKAPKEKSSRRGSGTLLRQQAITEPNVPDEPSKVHAELRAKPRMVPNQWGKHFAMPLAKLSADKVLNGGYSYQEDKSAGKTDIHQNGYLKEVEKGQDGANIVNTSNAAGVQVQSELKDSIVLEKHLEIELADLQRDASNNYQDTPVDTKNHCLSESHQFEQSPVSNNSMAPVKQPKCISLDEVHTMSKQYENLCTFGDQMGIKKPDGYDNHQNLKMTDQDDGQLSSSECIRSTQYASDLVCSEPYNVASLCQPEYITNNAPNESRNLPKGDNKDEIHDSECDIPNQITVAHEIDPGKNSQPKQLQEVVASKCYADFDQPCTSSDVEVTRTDVSFSDAFRTFHYTKAMRVLRLVKKRDELSQTEHCEVVRTCWDSCSAQFHVSLWLDNEQSCLGAAAALPKLTRLRTSHSQPTFDEAATAAAQSTTSADSSKPPRPSRQNSLSAATTEGGVSAVGSGGGRLLGRDNLSLSRADSLKQRFEQMASRNGTKPSSPAWRRSLCVTKAASADQPATKSELGTANGCDASPVDGQKENVQIDGTEPNENESSESEDDWDVYEKEWKAVDSILWDWPFSEQGFARCSRDHNGDFVVRLDFSYVRGTGAKQVAKFEDMRQCTYAWQMGLASAQAEVITGYVHNFWRLEMNVHHSTGLIVVEVSRDISFGGAPGSGRNMRTTRRLFKLPACFDINTLTTTVCKSGAFVVSAKKRKGKRGSNHRKFKGAVFNKKNLRRAVSLETSGAKRRGV